MSFETIKPLEIHRIKRLIESKQVEELVECLQKLEMHTESIGLGGNAEVFGIKEGPFSKVCLKKVAKIPQIRCNDIDTETKIQSMARSAGVRIPLALVSFEAGGQEYLIMERIIGNTVGEISASPSKLPENFDPKLFIQKLIQMVERMHNADIYHRDLHTNNVMIDSEGLPVIIDFGTAIHTPYSGGGDYAYEQLAWSYDYKKKNYIETPGIFKDDMVMVNNMKGSIAVAHTNNVLTKRDNRL